MRVLIAGVDGYLGWPLAQYLALRGHSVGGCDALLRRAWVEEMGSCSAVPVFPVAERLREFRATFGEFPFWQGDLRDQSFVDEAVRTFEPEAIVHLGECPSAPYSMIDRDHTVFVQTNNVVTTLNLTFAIRDLCPDAHLVKLGTMGEYGTPDVAIPEGFFDVEYRGRRTRMPFPRQAPSWYHWSKVHGSNNLMFASKIWDLRVTDVMQGIVFGSRFPGQPAAAPLRTRFDFDQCFGTVINRFCCQAVIGHPLTPYGTGGQKRGFLPLADSLQCLTLAIENPPPEPEYRVFNQFQEVYDIAGIACRVKQAATDAGLTAEIRPLQNPRKEMEDHYYSPDHRHLFDLGYRPACDVDRQLGQMIADLLPHRERIEAHRNALIPDIRWDGSRRASSFAAPRVRNAASS